MKRKTKGNFWQKLRFKYKLSIVNESTKQEVAEMRISKLNGVSLMFTIVLLILIITTLIIAFTPLRNFIPGYLNTNIRSQVIMNELAVDSLSETVEKQNKYIANIRTILKGDINKENISEPDSIKINIDDIDIKPTDREIKFRKDFEEEQKYSLNIPINNTENEGVIFFCPLKGKTTNHFNRKKEIDYVTILPEKKESIKAVLDGTIIFTDLTVNYGYVIEIQHSNGLLSAYYNCGKIIKDVGDRVKGGEAIGIPFEKTKSRQYVEVKFAMWNKGNSINPNLYIRF